MAFQHSQVKGLPGLSTGPCCYLERRRLNTAECFRFLRSPTYLPEGSSKGKGLKSKPKKRRSGALAINVFNGLLPSNRSLRCRGQNYAILSLSLSRSLSLSLHFTSQGKGPRVEDPRQGAPFPSLAEEGALGSSAVGVVPLGYSNWWRALGGTSPRP